MDISKINNEDNDRERGMIESRCYLLFKENESLADDSFTLGLPFVQPYTVMFDYANNKVGFRNKENSIVEVAKINNI